MKTIKLNTYIREISKTQYKVDEVLTSTGLYFTWANVFKTKQEAREAILREEKTRTERLIREGYYERT